VLADGVGSANQMAKAMEPYEPSPDVRVSDGSDAAWARAGLLKAAGRDHVGLIRKLPRLVRETTAGVSRVSRRSKERAGPSLPVHVDDPLERVRLTSMATTIAKENNRLLGPTLLPAWLSYFPRNSRRGCSVARPGEWNRPAS
jgi:hypothetical protein